jgi:hypothetical protein
VSKRIDHISTAGQVGNLVQPLWQQTCYFAGLAMFRCVSLLLLAGSLLCGQSTVTVEGSVVNRVTHQGISGVSVTLDRGTAGLSYRAVTGSDGSFKIANVEPGDYLPIFEKRGLSAADAPVKPQHFDAAAGSIRLHAEMIAWTRISGHVLDAQDHPLSRIHVTLIPMREGRTSSGTVAATDDSGAFIIATESGIYRLMASEDDAAEHHNPPLAPTYYPMAADPQSAQRIAILSGTDLSGFDIHMQKVQPVKVRGVVLDTHGSPLSGAPVKLVLPPAIWWDRDESETVSGDGGAFEFAAVRPGDWRVTAEVERGEGALFGFAAVRVAAADVSGVKIRLNEPFTVTGKVEGARAHGSSDLCELPGVSLISTDVDHETSSEVQDNGSLRLPEVYPGRYKIQVCGVSSGSYLASILVGDHDVLGQEFSLASGATLRVVFRSDGGTVRGTVEQGEGRTVALIPAEEGLLDPMFVQTTTAGDGGRFEFSNVRPGDYRAIAFDHVGDSAALSDPAFVRDLSVSVTAVQVERGQVATVSLKVVRWPE